MMDFFIIPYLRAISLSGVWSGTMKREGIGKNEKVGSVVYKNDKIIIIASNNNDNVVAKKPGDNRVWDTPEKHQILIFKCLWNKTWKLRI